MGIEIGASSHKTASIRKVVNALEIKFLEVAIRGRSYRKRLRRHDSIMVEYTIAYILGDWRGYLKIKNLIR